MCLCQGMSNMSRVQNIQLKTLDHLFRIQQALSLKKSNQKCESLANSKVSAYLRWQLKKRITGYEHKLGSLNKEPSPNKLEHLSGLCSNCWSTISDYKIIPKKSSSKKINKELSESNLIRGKCKFCNSIIKFHGLKKDKHFMTPVKSTKSTKFLNKASVKSFNDNYNVNKSSSTSSSQDHKELLQKYLTKSKKQKNLDGKTRLSDFLKDCF